LNRLLKLVGAVLILRFVAEEVVAFAARNWLSPGPAPLDSPRPPGWMPGPELDSGIKSR
jgi:hypothetical protein